MKNRVGVYRGEPIYSYIMKRTSLRFDQMIAMTVLQFFNTMNLLNWIIIVFCSSLLDVLSFVFRPLSVLRFMAYDYLFWYLQTFLFLFHWMTVQRQTHGYILTLNPSVFFLIGETVNVILFLVFITRPVIKTTIFAITPQEEVHGGACNVVMKNKLSECKSNTKQ